MYSVHLDAIHMVHEVKYRRNKLISATPLHLMDTDAVGMTDMQCCSRKIFSKRIYIDTGNNATIRDQTIFPVL